ncbi:MAG: type II toxin-antitoxin system Phd/YefM family antitoxin [Candidatus Roizmanbacteria bacterium]|nr:type II toxin-antitoxin system Phd/YefM family antitoxin [Candidatus Roizmanbacteria bacterium]
MDQTTTISITEARKRLFKIADEVQTPGLFYTLTEKGRPKAVLMSAEEFDSWKETLEVMAEFPDLKKDMERIDKAVETGEYKKWTTLENLLAKEGFVLHDKSSKKYEVSNLDRSKCRKKSKKTTKS